MLEELEANGPIFGASYQDSTGRTPAQQTMSSLEIAELTGKEHKNVIRDIRAMLVELGDAGLSFKRIYRLSFQPRLATPRTGRRGLSKFADTYRHAQNEGEIASSFAGYSVALRFKIVDRRQDQLRP